VRTPSRLEAALLALGVAAGVVGVALAGGVLFGPGSPAGERTLGGAALLLRSAFNALAITALVYGLAVAWRKIPPEALGLSAPVGPALVGLTGGLAVASATAGLALVAGGFRVKLAPPAEWPSLELLLRRPLSTLLGAAFEEVGFRAGLVGVLALAFGWRPALLVPAVTFAAAHLFNPGAGPLVILNGTLAGVILGLLFLDPAARAPGSTEPSLGLALGAHTGWNLGLFLLGLTVSGHATRGRWLEWQPVADTALGRLLAGGPFGIETSLPTTILYLLLGAWLWARVARDRRA
jgi:hypothetical protein